MQRLFVAWNPKIDSNLRLPTLIFATASAGVLQQVPLLLLPCALATFLITLQESSDIVDCLVNETDIPSTVTGKASGASVPLGIILLHHLIVLIWSNRARLDTLSTRYGRLVLVTVFIMLLRLILIIHSPRMLIIAV